MHFLTNEDPESETHAISRHCSTVAPAVQYNSIIIQYFEVAIRQWQQRMHRDHYHQLATAAAPLSPWGWCLQLRYQPQ